MDDDAEDFLSRPTQVLVPAGGDTGPRRDQHCTKSSGILYSWV
jgi:hypothetical protein